MALSIQSSPDVLGTIGAASASILNSDSQIVWLETKVIAAHARLVCIAVSNTYDLVSDPADLSEFENYPRGAGVMPDRLGNFVRRGPVTVTRSKKGNRGNPMLGLRNLIYIFSLFSNINLLSPSTAQFSALCT